MRRWVIRIAIAIVVLFAGSQLIPVDRTNPPVDESKTVHAVEKTAPRVQTVLDRSCNDCHSNETTWPWYSYVAPVSWMIANDVHGARKQMNFSEWGNYSPKQREEHLEEICEQLTNGDMPDFKYVLIHRKARVTPAERTALCQWTEDSRKY